MVFAYAAFASWAWWSALRPVATEWGTAADITIAVANILLLSWALYTTRREIASREKAEERADAAEARAQAIQADAQEQRKQEYASQVSWWTERCQHPLVRKVPEGEDDDREARHEHPTPDAASHHRPYMRGNDERGSGWPEDGQDVNRSDLLLVDLHIRNTGPHPLYACAVRSAGRVHFIGTITNRNTTFLERVLGRPGGTSSSFKVIGDIDAGADVEWIQFADAIGQDWRLDRQQQLLPMPRESRHEYEHP